MAEIRVRDASPELLKQIEAIALELKEATITGCLVKLIPRYHDLKKRIIECNNEIAALTRELRESQNRVANAGNDLTEFCIDMQNFGKDFQRHFTVIQKRRHSFAGTKKRRPAAAAATRKRKIVPSKKKKK